MFFVPIFSIAADEPLEDIRRLAQEQSYGAALEALDSLLSEQPNDVDARLFKGVVYTRLRRLDEAIATFHALTQAHPDLPEAHNNLAVLYAEQERFDEAREALIKAIKLQPAYDTAHENLGDVYTRLASLAYQRAYKLNEENGRASEKANWLDRLPVGTTGPDITDATPSQSSGSPDLDVANESPSPTPVEGALEPDLTKVSASCFRVEPFANEGEVITVTAWFEDRGATVTTEETSGRKPISHKVFLPPLESRAAALAKIEELNGRGINDIAIYSRGSLENAIGLGVFKDINTARERVMQIKKLGYDALLRPHYGRGKSYVLEIRAESGASIDPDEFAKAFPKQALKPKDCD